jgi:hypothetical protein
MVTGMRTIVPRGAFFCSLEIGAGLMIAFGCVHCHHVPAVSLAELFTAGKFFWKLLQQPVLGTLVLGCLFCGCCLFVRGGRQLTTATTAVGRASWGLLGREVITRPCSTLSHKLIAVGRACSSGTVTIHPVYPADVYMC